MNNEVTLEELKEQVSTQKKAEEDKGDSLLLIVFKLGEEQYALPIDQIKEVVLTPKIAKVPQTPDFVQGVANIRGNLIAILDLEEKFGIESIEDTEGENSGNYTLVIESDKFKIGILVKEVPNTLRTYAKNIDNSSGIMQYSSMDESCIKGIVKTESEMIILVDIISLMKDESLAKISSL